MGIDPLENVENVERFGTFFYIQSFKFSPEIVNFVENTFFFYEI